MILKAIYRGTIHPKAPYHFDYSVENPSHYPTPTGKWEPDKLWFTLRWRGEPYGFRMLNKGTINEPAIELTIHGAKKLAKKEIEALLEEMAYRFEWYGDYSEFYKRFEKDKLLGPVINKFEGMRMFCREDCTDTYGVGPASLDYLMRDVFHRRDALNTVPPWEAKIYSRLLFDKENEDVERILEEIKKKFGEWRAVAIHYLFMDLSWRQ